MLIDSEYQMVACRSPWSSELDPQREQLLNRLCELRADPRFAEWCRLTGALGLGNLPLGQLAALHADVAEGDLPGMEGRQADDGVVPDPPVDGHAAGGPFLGLARLGPVPDRRERAREASQ